MTKSTADSPIAHPALQEALAQLNQRMSALEVLRSAGTTPAETYLRYEFIFNNTNDLISIVDKNYIYRVINDAYIRVYGRPRERIIGRSVAEVWGPAKFNDIIRERFDRCLAGHRVNDQAWIDCGDAGLRYLDISYIPMPWDAQEDAVLVISHDTTEQKSVERTLAEREEHYRLLVENSLDLILTTDRDGDLIFLNPTAATYFKAGKNLLIFVHPEDLERMRHGLDLLRGGEVVQNLEIRVHDLEGRCRYLAINASPLRSPEGQTIGNSAIARDITHDRRFEHLMRSHGLSVRESEILRLVAQGYTNLNISRHLEIQESTVKFHMNRILRKTQTQNRTELTALLNKS